MRNETDFTVIIPTFNGSQYLKEALVSLAGQSLRPLEVIAVDDASTDNTVELLDSLGRALNIPLRIIRLEKNTGGPAQPMNIGVSQARGKYLLVLDQDDVLADDALKLHYNALSSSAAPVASVTWCARYGDSSASLLQDKSLCQALLVQSRKTDGCYLLPANQFAWLMICHGTIPVGFPGFAFPKKLWEQCGGFNEQLRIAVDFDFLCRLCVAGQVALIPQIGFFHRFHAQNACNNRGLMYYELALCTAHSAALFHKSLHKCSQELTSIHHRISHIYRKAGNLFANTGDPGMALRSWIKASLYDLNFIHTAKQFIKLVLHHTNISPRQF